MVICYMIKQESLVIAVKKKHFNSFKDVQVFKKNKYFRCILYLTDPSDVFLD